MIGWENSCRIFKLLLLCSIGDLFSSRYICHSQRSTYFRLFNSKLMMKNESISFPARLTDKMIDVSEALAFFEQGSYQNGLFQRALLKRVFRTHVTMRFTEHILLETLDHEIEDIIFLDFRHYFFSKLDIVFFIFWTILSEICETLFP